MSACNPITFRGITRKKYQAIRARIYAQAGSVRMGGDTGSATGDTPLGEFSASWEYDEAALTFTVTCTKKPLFVSEGMIRSRMQSLIESVDA